MYTSLFVFFCPTSLLFSLTEQAVAFPAPCRSSFPLRTVGGPIYFTKHSSACRSAISVRENLLPPFVAVLRYTLHNYLGLNKVTSVPSNTAASIHIEGTLCTVLNNTKVDTRKV